MADAKKCDRCGKFYSIRPVWDEESGTTHPASDGRRILGVKLFGICENTIESYDLCPECANKLTTFLWNYDEESEDEHIIFANDKKFIKVGDEGAVEVKEEEDGDNNNDSM